MLNFCKCINKEDVILSASFNSDLSVTIKNDTNEELAIISSGQTIQNALKMNGCLDSIIEKKISSLVCFTKAGREEAKVRKVAEIVFSLTDSLIKKEEIASSEERSGYRVIRVDPCSPSEIDVVRTVLRLCPYEKYSNKDWFKKRAPYVNAALTSEITKMPSEVRKPNTCCTKCVHNFFKDSRYDRLFYTPPSTSFIRSRTKRVVPFHRKDTGIRPY